MAHDRPKLELSGTQIIGGALAAASAAVASSWLGVAGTVLGAVIVSLVASVGSALYTHSLQRSSRAIRETLPVVPLRPVGSFGRAGTAEADPMATAVLPAVAPELETTEVERAVATPRRASKGIQWRTVAVSAAASLALAAPVLTGFESFVGKPASSLTGAGHGGGTTVSQLLGHSSTSTTPNDPSTAGDPGQNPGTSGPTPTAGTGSSPTGSVDQGQPTQPTQPTQPAQPTPTGPTPTDGQPTGSTPTGGTPTGDTPTPTTPTGSAPTTAP
jgi:hypothetical protein